ncbi:MAG: hypothetical protein IJR98_00695 [Synergistaceae bacterium]|nr:hypothetical protein [Synergistaceae bacterium]
MMMQLLLQSLIVLCNEEPDFLEGKGLSNEVNIRIFCYDAEDEMVVQYFVEQIKTDQSLDCCLVECNLYKTFLSICDNLDITDAIPDIEESDGGIFLAGAASFRCRRR